MSALSDIKREAQPSILYLIKHELRVFWIASKTIHFIPILSLCLRKNFEYRCCISRENQGKSFVKIYVCFITYKGSFTAMIFFVSCSWIINEFLKKLYYDLSILCNKKLYYDLPYTIKKFWEKIWLYKHFKKQRRLSYIWIKEMRIEKWWNGGSPAFANKRELYTHPMRRVPTLQHQTTTYIKEDYKPA